MRRHWIVCGALVVTSTAAIGLALSYSPAARLAHAASPSPVPLPPVSGEKAAPKFVGPKKCKLCHLAASTGAQFKVWEASPHAKAYESLLGPKAKEIAKAKGIEQPEKATQCLRCHVTGFGEPAERLGDKIVPENGVSCESCHGAGEHYSKKEVFEKGREEAIAHGLVIPDEKLCRTCHNEDSPQFTGFDYEAGLKKIAHPRPAGQEK
jgi:hypothetical protein